MSNDEVERAIGFLLESQAKHDTQIGELREQIAETNRIVQLHAESQTEFIQIITRSIEAQGEVNASLRAAVARTDERLDRLEAVVEKLVEHG
jgi:hypothetical protein